MIKIQEHGIFLATAYASLANVASATHGTDFTSSNINLDETEELQAQIEATGIAAAAGDITVDFAATLDGINYDTLIHSSQRYTEAKLTVSGTGAQRVTIPIDVAGLKAIRVQKIANATGQTITNIQVRYGLLRGW